MAEPVVDWDRITLTPPPDQNTLIVMLDGTGVTGYAFFVNDTLGWRSEYITNRSTSYATSYSAEKVYYPKGTTKILYTSSE